jgi:hypothetical protein
MSDIRGHGRTGSGDEPSLDAIRRSDGFIDALASGRPAAPQDAADAELAALLGGWRDELRSPPSTNLISESDAVAALNAGLARNPVSAPREKRTATPTRPRRGLSVVGAAAAAVLCIGGFGAVVAGAGPGDALYGLRSMLFGAPTQVRDDQVALAARTELNQVQDLIAQGDWAQAQDKLVAVSTQVATIEDSPQKQELLDQFNDLSAKVVERDPEATAPPGIVYTVPPSATDLVPAVAPPTSTPSAPSATDSATSISESASSSGTTSASPTTTATSASATTTATTTAAPTTTATTTAAPTTTATTTAAPTTTKSTATTTAAPTTAATTTAAPAATTTAAPTAAATTTAAPTAAATTTAAPAAAATTTAAPAAAATTTAAPAAAATTTAAPTAAATTAAETTTAAPAQAPAADPVTEEAPAEEAPAGEAPAIVTTTEAVVPVG